MEETLPGKLPQRKITQGAASGYSSYGNQIGLATGLVDEVYDEDYVAKRMEIGAEIGAAPADHVNRKVPAPGMVRAAQAPAPLLDRPQSRAPPGFPGWQPGPHHRNGLVLPGYRNGPL